MINKKFKYRLDSTNKVLFKEDIQNTCRGDEVKVRAVIGFTEDYSIAEHSVIRNGLSYTLDNFVNSDDCKDTKDILLEKINSGKLTTYFDLANVNYLGLLHITFVGEEVVKERVNLYIPIGIEESTSELICTNVDATLSEDALKTALQNAKNLISARMG